MSIKKYKVHLLGGKSHKNWDGIGTHPMFGIGLCDEIGELTDCLSLITCSKCQQYYRERNDTNKWLEQEWLKQKKII